MAEAPPPAAAPACTLAILARAPAPGHAKTRLIPRLGPEGAAALHAILVARTLRAARAAQFDGVTLWCAPGRDDPFFRAAAGGGVALADQPPGDLGDRMHAAFAAHLARDPTAVLVGTDCPALTPGLLGAARAALAGGAEAVLIPAEDGGYAALGLTRLDRRVFDGVPWGTAAVLDATRERLARLGWRVRELAPVRDVDLPADVDWLVASGLLDAAEREAVARLLR